MRTPLTKSDVAGEKLDAAQLTLRQIGVVAAIMSYLRTQGVAGAEGYLMAGTVMILEAGRLLLVFIEQSSWLREEETRTLTPLISRNSYLNAVGKEEREERDGGGQVSQGI